jgi:hypothetical protein
MCSTAQTDKGAAVIPPTLKRSNGAGRVVPDFISAVLCTVNVKLTKGDIWNLYYRISAMVCEDS